jgi:hypothetical protein
MEILWKFWRAEPTPGKSLPLKIKKCPLNLKKNNKNNKNVKKIS